MIELVAIVSSFNRAALLKEGISSLSAALAGLKVPSAIVVIDAGSCDGSRQTFEKAARHFQIPSHFLEKTGISFAAGVNFAVEHATKTYPTVKYFLLFETDNFLASPQPIGAAMRFLDSHGFAAAGFTVTKHDGSNTGFGRPFPMLAEFLVGPHAAFRFGWDNPRLIWKRWRDTNWAECDVVYTSPILIRREPWELSGGFDALEFPFSDCDVDWARRLQKLGFAQAVIQSNEVVHDNQLCQSAWSASRDFHFHRGRFRFLKREFGELIYAALPILIVRHFAELVMAITDIRNHGKYRANVWKRLRMLGSALRGYR